MLNATEERLMPSASPSGATAEHKHRFVAQHVSWNIVHAHQVLYDKTNFFIF